MKKKKKSSYMIMEIDRQSMCHDDRACGLLLLLEHQIRDACCKT